MGAGNPGDNSSEAASRPRILVAEDNPSNYKLVEVLLRRNFDLQHAWDGVEAVEMYRSHKADLVLMDISMPNMDGYEALRLIREFDPKSRVVALTAFAFDADRQRMGEAGFDDCLPKPLTPGDFPQRVAAYLNK